MYQSHYSVPLTYDLTTSYILGQDFVKFLGQDFVKFFDGFLENLRHQKDILRLTDLYLSDIIVLLGIIFVAFHIISINQ